MCQMSTSLDDIVADSGTRLASAVAASNQDDDKNVGQLPHSTREPLGESVSPYIISSPVYN